MSSVQFHGPEAVLTAYENRKVAAWSIWQGRQFMFKFEKGDIEQGAEELEKILEALGTSSNAVYTLRVYEAFDGRITSKTADDGSFNFRLNLEGQAPTVGQLGAYGRGNEIASRLSAIEERLKHQDEEDDDEEEGGFNLGRVLSGILERPDGMEVIKNFVQGIFSTMQQPTATALAGVESETPLQKSLAALSQKVEDLPQILAKLARLAEKKPKQFAFYINALRVMDV